MIRIKAHHCPLCNWILDYELVILYRKETFGYYCEQCDLYFREDETK